MNLEQRIKTFYEKVWRITLPRRCYTIIRIDGKAFHTYTKGLERPFDGAFIDDMDKTAIHLCENIQGVKMAYTQSDEISLVLTDFDTINTSAWFDGNIQKIASVSASIATAKFNHLRLERGLSKIAYFDSRCFVIPSLSEVVNYLIQRQNDTVRNSISSVAQTLYSSKELHKKNTDQMQEMCFQKGINWNDYDPKLKRGRLIIKESYKKNGADRTRWISTAPPILTQDSTVITDILPVLK